MPGVERAAAPRRRHEPSRLRPPLDAESPRAGAAIADPSLSPLPSDLPSYWHVSGPVRHIDLDVVGLVGDPTAQIFSDIEGFGTTTDWEPCTPSRWSVATDRGDARYFLDTTEYSQGPDGMLGAYSLYAPETYGDFVFRMTARSNEDLAANPQADFAVVFGYLNAQNYSFMSFSNSAAGTRLVRVEDGRLTVVATANRAGIVDSEYHPIQVWHHGYWLRVLVDQQEILSVNGTVKEVGKLGVGSLDDSAFFDDVQAASYDLISTPHYALSAPSDQRAHEGAVSSKRPDARHGARASATRARANHEMARFTNPRCQPG